jgi:hypothetical protein
LVLSNQRAPYSACDVVENLGPNPVWLALSSISRGFYIPGWSPSPGFGLLGYRALQKPHLGSRACAARERRADARGITRGEERHGERQTDTELWSESERCRNRLKFVCFSKKKKKVVVRGIPTGTGWCRRCRRGKFFFCGSHSGGEGVGETERHRVCVCVCGVRGQFGELGF